MVQPEDSGYSRFLYFIRYLARNDFYIIIDDHLAVDTTVIDDPGAHLASRVMLSETVRRCADIGTALTLRREDRACTSSTVQEPWACEN